ncbi:MAG: hypothetical protein COW00_20005 [Bdellovibrio sp. CG12_big_fil_rev_8_21_14_0_65_39_13]|nr:MAG: hypothetical protein COW78_02180 [Bdellovibrio sp. CG22_combo_CG10-13_8_21_14_all_39_27]PIQ57658.1 MAG: hypothetical protein COW00_20005 [Bdellovibrio sp. CG12_big_fil_rev_8_21_14_0_65_39_13]PIR35822.1 MAG: hypothetical protein COV37_06385 [Bdellovibrio sp. CG11_big_fil_rev_8_21_14_0_20_39_38]
MKVDHQLLINANQYLKDQGIKGQIVFRSERSHLVRAGRNQVSLNTSEEAARFFVQIQLGKKQSKGEFVLKNNTTEELIHEIKELQATLPLLPEIDHLGDLLNLAQGDYNDDHSDMDMINMDTSLMVDVYAKAVNKFADKGCEVSGAFSLGTYAYSIINTNVEQPISYRGSDYNVDVVLQLKEHNNKEIKSSQVGASLAEINADAMIEELDRHFLVKTTTHRKSVPIGKYNVIFGPEAVAEILAYTSWVGFSGESYLMQTGMFKKGQHDIGSKVFGDNITITNDPTSKHSLFKRRVGLNGILRPAHTIINKGILKNLIYSSKDICDRYGIVVDNDFATASFELLPGTGPATWTELVQQTKEPTLYINTLHYMNFTNVAKGEFTATSRFGTYLISEGKVQDHLYNIRVNDSFHHVFNNVHWLSSKITSVNLSSTYGMRLASSVSVPEWIEVKDVPITACFAPELSENA